MRPGLPLTGWAEWLLLRQISQIWLCLEAVGVNKLFGFFFYVWLFLEAVGTCYQTGVLPFLSILLKSVIRLF